MDGLETATVAFVAKHVPQMGLKLYRLVSEPWQLEDGEFFPPERRRSRGPFWKTNSSASRSIR